VLAAAVTDVVAQVREAYEFYQLDSDKAMAAQIFVQQVGQILETENGENAC
jgi:hypothetical protein